jgi:condensation domain-containing protein
MLTLLPVYPSPPGQAEFLKQGDREEQMWALQTVRRMSPKVDQEQWIAATTMLTKVNDILRTSWLWSLDDEKWVGLVLRSSKLDLIKVNCRDEKEATAIIEATWNRKFVFGEPFITYAMLTYLDGSWDLVIKMNHAVYDGTLLRIFDDHFAAILRKQEVPQHTEFRDFAFHIFESDKADSVSYWKTKMTGSRNVSALTNVPWASAAMPGTTNSLIRPLATHGIDKTAKSLGVTPSIIFQGAFQLWLSHATTSWDIGFDYLLTGRNVHLPEPQTINGTVANFLPVRISVNPVEPLASFLARTQDDFWADTDHGNLGLDEIYRVAGLSRIDAGNRVLFLFQPFEPAAKNDPNADFRWLVMAKSKVRMPMPYALVVEVFKTAEKAHSLKVSYDETILKAERAREIADEIAQVIQSVAEFDGNEMERTVETFMNL